LTKFGVPIMQFVHEMDEKLDGVIIFLWVVRLFGSVVVLYG
jgi:hypothetical protein